MKKLNKEETEKVALLGRAGAVKNNKEIFEVLHGLQMGESILLPKDEWKGKTPPSMSIAGTFRANRGVKRFSVFQTEEKTAWLITRITDRKI